MQLQRTFYFRIPFFAAVAIEVWNDAEQHTFLNWDNPLDFYQQNGETLVELWNFRVILAPAKWWGGTKNVGHEDVAQAAAGCGDASGRQGFTDDCPGTSRLSLVCNSAPDHDGGTGRAARDTSERCQSDRRPVLAGRCDGVGSAWAEDAPPRLRAVKGGA